MTSLTALKQYTRSWGHSGHARQLQEGPASAPSCDAHRALETIDVAVSAGPEGERQNPLAEFAVSLIEIPRECLRRRSLVAAAHAHDDREEIGVDFSGVEKRSLCDRDARPGLRLIASADEIVVRRRRGAGTAGSSATEARIMSGVIFTFHCLVAGCKFAEIEAGQPLRWRGRRHAGARAGSNRLAYRARLRPRPRLSSRPCAICSLTPSSHRCAAGACRGLAKRSSAGGTPGWRWTALPRRSRRQSRSCGSPAAGCTFRFAA